MPDPRHAPRAPDATIRPAVFDAAPGARPHPARRDALGRAAVLASCVVLGAAVLFVIFVLPRVLHSGVPVATVEAPRAGRPAPAADPAARAGDAGSAAARKAAQAALAESLAALAALEERGAQRWAAAEIDAARERIAAGEKAYRERRFAAAHAHYAAADATSAALTARLPAIAAGFVAAGVRALERGEATAADAAFAEALAIDADHAAAAAGRARAQTLDEVLALLAQAAAYERLDAPEKALRAYREALALDALAPGAAPAAQRLEQLQQRTRLRAAMSAGFAALEAQDFAAAKQAFERAAALAPGRPEVTDALAHLAAAQTTWRIERYLVQGAQASGAERWAEAIAAYDQALALDDGLVDARRARATAVMRRRLDTALAGYLAAPTRLHDEAVRSDASRVLAEARDSGARGTRLDGQLEALARALERARTPRLVTLRSDGATEVTLQRVGTLGTFAKHSLELLPGTYVALGRRDGYRDARVEFTVAHDGAPAAVTIQCRERFSFGS